MFLRTCCWDIFFSQSMSVMMMATMRLIMMIVPSTMTPVRSSIVKVWETPEVALEELFHRSSNSNSPRTITKLSNFNAGKCAEKIFQIFSPLNKGLWDIFK